jgi:Tfp pilus assembly protein PilV
LNARSESGFMLLEVLLAATILAVGLFAIIDGLGRCLAAARGIQNYATAETMLANKSFEFRTDEVANTLNQEGNFADEHPGFSWTRTFDQTDTEGLWQQTITVYWYERGKLSSDSVVEYRYLPDKQR